MPSRSGPELYHMLPLKRIVPKTPICIRPWQIIFFHMFAVIKDSFLETGFLVKSSSVGGSVAKAREARVSIIRLTHNI
jgi:hypothetical protein